MLNQIIMRAGPAAGGRGPPPAPGRDSSLLGKGLMPAWFDEYFSMFTLFPAGPFAGGRGPPPASVRVGKEEAAAQVRERQVRRQQKKSNRCSAEERLHACRS